MKIMCTYCSAAKDPSKEKIPAFKRYISTRIKQVGLKADVEHLDFYILSGKYGLVEQHELIGNYDYELLGDEVSGLTQKVRKQLSEIGATQVDYFSYSGTNSELTALYMSAIEEACRGCVTFCCRELQENKDSKEWGNVQERGADAGLVLLRDTAVGEQLFENLLRQFPKEGMLYWERAKALRMLGELSRAKTDYEMAK